MGRFYVKMHEIFSIFKNSYIYLSMPYSSFFKLFSDFFLKNRAILVCFSLIFWVSAFLINSLFSCKNPHSAPLPLDHPHGLRIPPWALFFYHLKISAKNVISFLHGGCKRKRDEIQISRFFFYISNVEKRRLHTCFL